MTDRNSLATMTSRQTFEWPTPQAFFDDLNAEFGFTVDVAANAANAKCARFYTIEDDGLSQDWDGETVWCNPPYGDQLKHWIYKAASSAATVVMLVPARVDTRWFHDLVLDRAEVRFVRGRIKFEGAKWTAPFPCMVLVFRGQELASSLGRVNDLINEASGMAIGSGRPGVATKLLEAGEGVDAAIDDLSEIDNA